MMSLHHNSFARYLSMFVGIVAVFTTRDLYAHESGDVAGGLLSGLTHPLFGVDHVVAMVAVGLWGGQLKQPAIWLLPVTFPIVMAVGGVFGARGIPLPAVEVGIAISAVVLGLLVAAQATPPLWVAAIIVGAFAVFHGHAHGTELPESATPTAYGAGFVISTGLLHAAGIALGSLVDWRVENKDAPDGEIGVSVGGKIVRICGGAITCVGIYFLLTALSG